MLLIIINALIICYGLGRMFVFLFFWQNVNISLISGRYNFCTFILFRDIYTIFFLGCYLLRYHMLSNFGINFRGQIFEVKFPRSLFRGWTYPRVWATWKFFEVEFGGRSSAGGLYPRVWTNEYEGLLDDFGLEAVGRQTFRGRQFGGRYGLFRDITIWAGHRSATGNKGPFGLFETA